MAKQLTTEKEIKKALKVKSFSELPLDKYDDLAQLLVNTKKDVAIGIINQLPEYMTYAKEMLSKLERTEPIRNILRRDSRNNETIPLRFLCCKLPSKPPRFFKVYLSEKDKATISNVIDMSKHLI